MCYAVDYPITTILSVVQIDDRLNTHDVCAALAQLVTNWPGVCPAPRTLFQCCRADGHLYIRAYPRVSNDAEDEMAEDTTPRTIYLQGILVLPRRRRLVDGAVAEADSRDAAQRLQHMLW